MNGFFSNTAWQRRCASFILVFCLVAVFFPLQSEAYFNRGTVSLSLGENALSLTAGTVSSVSVTIDPIKQDQLPGCGMAECPQTCGDGCLNESGECMCAGTEYRTYYSEVAVSSSDASIASASYANGTLTVNGNAPGTASISVTGKLRQYTDSTVVLPVTVTAAVSSGSPSRTSSGSSSAPSASSGNVPVPSNTNSVPQQNGTGNVSADSGGSSVIVEEASPGKPSVPVSSPSQDETASGEMTENSNEGSSYEGAEDSEENETKADFLPEGELRDTARGKYRFVELSALTDIPACFVDSANEGSHLVFQKKSGENIAYSWTFDGKNLDPHEDYSDLKLGIRCPASVPDKLEEKIKGKNALCMSFDYSGKLPDTARIYINVRESFPEDQDLFLYRISKSDGKLTKVSDHVEMSNGYASFSLDHCSDYLLTDSGIPSEKANEDGEDLLSPENRLGAPMIILLIVVIGSAVFMLLYNFIHKKNRRQR